MFGLSRGKPATPTLTGRYLVLAPPCRADRAEWQALRASSRAFLTPWEPRWANDELSDDAWRRRLVQWTNDAAAGSAHTFFARLAPAGPLAGGISVFNIRHGAAQSAEIGYWLGQPHAGRGLMGEAIGLVAPWCFGKLGLRRLVAACIPDNQRSRRVLEKAGFECEGVVRSYLRINGVRRDHLLFSLVAPDDGATLTGDRADWPISPTPSDG